MSPTKLEGFTKVSETEFEEFLGGLGDYQHIAHMGGENHHLKYDDITIAMRIIGKGCFVYNKFITEKN